MWYESESINANLTATGPSSFTLVLWNPITIPAGTSATLWVTFSTAAGADPVGSYVSIRHLRESRTVSLARWDEGQPGATASSARMRPLLSGGGPHPEPKQSGGGLQSHGVCLAFPPLTVFRFARSPPSPPRSRCLTKNQVRGSRGATTHCWRPGVEAGHERSG